MSIAEQIIRIKNNISDAFTECESLGASIPQSQNSGNLARTISSIPTGIPSETVTGNQMNAMVRAYLSETTYDPSDYTESRIATYSAASTTYRKDRPADLTVTSPAAGSLTVYDGSASVSQDVVLGSFAVSSLTPGVTSSYIITGQNLKAIAAGFLNPTGALRMINGGGNTFNIRDLGGWNCDGGTLKYGKIFRGCELNGDNYNIPLSEAQKEFFRNYLGIRDEIDLRGNSEVDGDDDIYGTMDDITASALGTSVDYVRYPIAAYANGVNLNNRTQTEYYAALIRRIAYDVSHEKPCYIHCMAGADRTGTLCALIEAICGVSQSDIDKDYELTSFSDNLRQRSDAAWVGLISAITSMTGSTFRDKAVAYALQAGVSIEEINTLRKALIDGTPVQLTSPFLPASVTKTLTDVTVDNLSASTTLYQPYEINLMPVGSARISDVSVTMNGVDITRQVFDGTKSNLLHQVSKTLNNCTIDNSKATVIDGEGYAASLTAATGYTLNGATVSILMGGINVSNYYSNGKITIPCVTGNIVITASAVPSAPENYVDEVGYTDSTRWSVTDGTVKESAGFTAINEVSLAGGYPKTVTLSGINWRYNDSCVIIFNTNGTFTASKYLNREWTSTSLDASLSFVSGSNNEVTITLNSDKGLTGFKVCGYGSGADAVINIT